MLDTKIKWALAHFKALVANSVLDSTAETVRTIEELVQERAYLLSELQQIRAAALAGGPAFSFRLEILAKAGIAIEKVLS